MEDRIEIQGLKHLENIEEDLEEIKSRTPGTKRMFFNGMLHGAGIVAGSLFALACLGWLLSLFGFVPGLEEFKTYIEHLREDI